MSFFSRPNIDDIQFKQLSGSTLTLSGQTRIATSSGLTLIGTSGYIPIDVTSGNTNYNVLTYCNGLITLLPQSGGGSGVYSGASPTTCTVGGLCSGSPIVGCSISTILEKILVPPIPLTSSISIASGGASRQFGDCSVGNLCWCVIKNTYPICGISASTNGSGTYNCTLLTSGSINSNTGGTLGYTYAFSCATPSSACTLVTSTPPFKILTKSTGAEVSTGSTSIVWQNKKFYFGNSTLYNSSAISVVLSATTGNLSTTKALNISQTLNNQFFYYAYPKVFGVPSFVVNGLPNNAWGNQSTGTLFTITFINTNGYSNQYYVARSDNRITGTFSIIVS
jgi:hypothetical protein